jgi:hypothetical protein
VRRLSGTRTLVLAAAGPALIVVSVLAVLHDLAFGGLVPSQQNDVLGFWLPNHCFLGRALAGGNIPEWNPHVLGGVPFAADPQSGWMYVPAMVLYAALPCDAALPAFIVLQPLIAGLAMYWFLRSEGISRVAATVGGLALSLVIAASRTAVSLPVSGSLAWSALLLALVSRLLSATTWSARLLWTALAGLAWGQLAAAHFSHGLATGTATVLVYLAARGIAEVRAGRRTAGDVLAVTALLLAVLVPLNLAYLLPRLAYLPRSTVGAGYDGLNELTARLSGHSPPAVVPRAPGGYAWPLKFATAPGAYLGAVPLLLAFAGFRVRRLRPLAVAGAIVGAGSYLLSLAGVARALAPLVRDLPYGDVYLHAPSRLRYGIVLVLPLLGAIGVEAWRQTKGTRWPLLVGGAVVWLLLPPLVGVDPSHLALPWAGAAAGVAALVLVARRPRLLPGLPALLSVELAVGAFIGQAAENQVRIAPSRAEVAWRTPFENLLEPDVDAGAYLAAGSNARTMRSEVGRYLSVQPWREARAQGYVGRWKPGEQGLLDNQRAMLFGLEDANGYNPVQPLRWWTFSRGINPAPPKYNVTVFPDLDPVVLDLLQVNWLIGPRSLIAVGFREVGTEGPWALYRGPTRPRASLVGHWTVVPSPDAALEAVSSPGFEPGETVVLEEPPGIAAVGTASTGTATYRGLGPEQAVLTVDAPAPAVLLVRNSFDPNWTATVDGREAPVLPADHFLQSIPVPAGRHTVRLRYDDPTVEAGVLGSAVTLAALVAAAVLARRVERRRLGPSGLRRNEAAELPPLQPAEAPPSAARRRR